MICKFLRKRSRKYNVIWFCKYKGNEIILDECENCLNLIVERKKGIKKVSKKRVFVNNDTYNKVFDRDKGLCRLCGNNNIQLHHIIYRSEDKSKINDIDNCIMLCDKCHRLVHSNKKKYQKELLDLVKGEKYE